MHCNILRKTASIFLDGLYFFRSPAPNDLHLAKSICGCLNENFAASPPRKSFVTTVAAVFRMAVGVQPAQQRANAAVCQRNTRIGSAVVEIDCVPIFRHRIAARKYDVLNISLPFILRFRRKHPGIPTAQAFVRLLRLKVDTREPKLIHTVRGVGYTMREPT